MTDRLLKDLADIVRSKNAGPYRITFDILFKDRERYEAVRSTGVIRPETVAAAYGIAVSEVSSFFEIDMANAIKITIRRPRAQGSSGDGDMYGCQHHVPLMLIRVPVA
ncbi:DUF4387 domain-containing protein [Azospirillum rugosum]|uniref:DUF4387 domain-containing protein n=1 Tax=Azospirillum rugosum TaxID=416170 RepID=A0ABS4SW81_9PROT|nr:DUF4387 domain-containing protein [Azospirillum rugosum]MBP2296804.1 hypothetical protein [Azospirillum rugosum]MDQ0530407.1 hypothetical protein [Azospirillum rugosum]